jgi:ABC-type branched-subunit amino acid transport system permease subunit
MSFALQYYVITLLVYFGVNCMAAWALNFQYGVAGIVSFGFIVFQSVGAYTAAVTTLGPSSESGFQTYDFGARLPWPVALLLAGVVGAALAAGVGAIALRFVNRLFQGLMMLVVVILAGIIVTAEPGFLNGGAGVAAVPPPLRSSLNLSLINWGWFYVGLTCVITVVAFFLLYKLTESPWGRKLRAIRDNPAASEALGIHVYRESLIAFTVGGAVAAISGAVLVGFIGAWAPAGWTYGETLVYFTAIIVGGTGNMYGVAVGVAK